MQTEFVRSLNCNYERLLLDKMPEEKRYQYCILNRGGIRGLLSCNLRYINGLAYLYYDISSRQSVKQLYSTRYITGAWVKDFIWSLGQIRQELERFLLDTGNIIFYPEQIFQDPESNVFSFLYVPYYDGESGLKQLLEFWVEHIDYDDEILVDCVYHMYEQVEKNGELYLQTQIFEDVKKLDEPAPLPEPAVQSQREEKPDEKTEEQKKHFFGIFENRKRKNRDWRENYRHDMQEIMEERAVAEDTVYGEEYGRTIYIEETKETENAPRQLCTPEGKTVALLDKPIITIGKRKEDADAFLNDMSVSRLHARVVKEKEVCYIEDLNSTNGTFKNGLRLQPYERKELEAGDEIKVGRVVLVFR